MKTTVEIYKGKTIFEKENGKYGVYFSSRTFSTLGGVKHFINENLA